MSFIPLPVVLPSGSAELEVRVTDNDMTALMREMIVLQKVMINHLQHITDEVYAEEDEDGTHY